MRHAGQRPDLFRCARIGLIALALAYAFAAGLRTLGDFDLGWQLATGRWIVEHGQIPSTDFFSYTASGKEWIYPVLSQVLLYLTYAIGGYRLLSWFGVAACVGTVALLLRRSSLIGLILVIASVPLIAACTPPRAEMFTAVLFAAYVSLLWHFYRSGRGPLWLLPILMCLWVNLHLGFIAGLAMCLAYVVLELEGALAASRPSALFRLRRAAPWLGATAVATIANPWGWRIYAAIERQSKIVATHSRWIWEWQGLRLTPAAMAKAFAWRDPQSAVYWLMLVAVIAVLCALVQRKFVAAFLLASAIYFVVHAIRMEASFASITVVVGGTVLTDTVATLRKRRMATPFQISARNKVFAMAAMALGATLFAGFRIVDLVTNRTYLKTPFSFSVFGTGESFWQPKRAGAFVLRERLPRNLFNDFDSGGFVVWNLWPQYLDYIDGRSVPFGGPLLLKNTSLLENSLDSAAWTDEANAQGINTIFLSMDFEAGTALRSLGSYCEAQQWRPVFLDVFGAVFLRIIPETADQVRQLGIDCRTVQFAEPPATASDSERFRYFVNGGTIFIVLDRNAEGLQSLEKAERIFAENAFLHYAKGIALGNLGYDKDSERELLLSIKLGSTDDAPPALARIYEREGRYAAEEVILRGAAEQSVTPHWFYLMLGNVELKLRRPDLALASFKKAEQTSPFRGEAYSLGSEFRRQIAAGQEQAMRSMPTK